VLEGARAVCSEAGIALAGGHTIDSLEPVFGLAVTGSVALSHLRKNNTAQPGDLVFLTKPVGVGILSTALKRGQLDPSYYPALVAQMTTLNSIGQSLGIMPDIHALTDVTGFGLLGHLVEMAEGSALSAELFYGAIEKIDGLDACLQLRTIPDATFRNWNSYSSRVAFEPGVNVMEAFNVLPDPQTNGGLLIAVAESGVPELLRLFSEHNISAMQPVARIVDRKEKVIYVKA
ncbi:MAG TPA: selenide, water dikinase SelD, partial [Flavisolibacter sp.]